MSRRAGVEPESRRAVEHGELGELARQGERSLGSRKKFAIWTVCRCREAFTENLALENFTENLALENFRKTPGRKNTFTNWRTWAGEEVGSRERGSTGRP